MSNPTKPTDLGIPANQYTRYIPLANKYLEDGSVPIFWGDNQKRDEETLDYDRPSGMKEAPIHIPKVVRFLYTYDRDDEIDDDHKGDTGGGDPPVPDIAWYSKVNFTGRKPILKTAFRDVSKGYSGYAWIPIDTISLQLWVYDPLADFYDPQPDSYHYIGDWVNYGVLPDPQTDYFNGAGDLPLKLKIKSTSDGSVLFFGSIFSCPFFDISVYRSFFWYRTVDGTMPGEFVLGTDAYYPPGSDKDAPPACTYPDFLFNPATVIKTEHPLGDYLFILGDYGPCEGDVPP